MSHIVRTHRVENRLAKAVSTAGGMTIEDALEQAAQAVEHVREECMDALDAKIAEIDAVTKSGKADVARVYALANEILNEAGVFGLSELSEAGRSLCELTSNCRDRASSDMEPIRVHVVAMKSLRRTEVAADTAMRSAVIEGLRALTAKFSASAARAAG